MTTRGIIYQYGLRIEAEDMQYVEAVKEAEGRPFWTAAYKQVYPGDYYYRYLDGEYVVSLLRGINDLGNYKTMLGIERITFDEAYIEALYSGIMIGDGRMYIVNRDREVVSSTDKSMLGSNLSRRRTVCGAVRKQWIFRTGWECCAPYGAG